jgi:hypothetical protein
MLNTIGFPNFIAGKFSAVIISPLLFTLLLKYLKRTFPVDNWKP